MEQMKPQKIPKKKGPIRTEAIVPVFIICLLIFGYFKFLFDRQLKSAIEWGGGYIYGAEINVGDIETSFLKLYFILQDLQVTDKSKPERNLVSIEKIRFDLLGDALLRAKLVIEDSSILNIQAYSPRKNPGYVRPPEPPSSNKKPSIIDDIEARAEARFKKQYDKNVLGDLANIATGTDAKDQLKNIQAQLKSEQKIKELEKFIKEKEKEWKERIEKFPKKDEVNVLVKRSKELKFNTKNPIQFAKDLKEADKIYREMNDIVKNVKESSKNLKTDVGSADQGIKDIERFVKEDVEDLKKRLKIPSFDSKSFTQAIFMSMLNDKLKNAEKFVAVSREYMPTKKKDASEPLVPRARAEGRNIPFPITKGYPLFWLKKAAVSSKASESELSGNIAGQITNFTTSPKFIGKPAIIDLKGNFPKQEIQGFSAEIKIDHTTDIPKESFNIKVDSYPFSGIKIADSGDLKLSMNKSLASLNMGGIFANEKLSLAVQNTFRKSSGTESSSGNFSVEAKQKLLQELLQKVFASLPEIIVNASFEGTFLDFETHLNSNLGAALEEGISREISAKIKDQQKLIEDFVQNRIKGDKDKLTSEFKKAKDKIESEILGKEKEMSSEVDQAKNDISKQKSGGTGSSGKPKIKNLKDLKKSFGF